MGLSGKAKQRADEKKARIKASANSKVKEAKKLVKKSGRVKKKGKVGGYDIMNSRPHGFAAVCDCCMDGHHRSMQKLSKAVDILNEDAKRDEF